MNRNVFQTASKPPVPDLQNEAGGPAYDLGAEAGLAQLAMTSCFNGTYYTSAEDQLNMVLALAKKCSPEYAARVAVYARRHGLMKDTPAVLCAHLAAVDVQLLKPVFGRVVDNARMLRGFVQALRSGVTGRKNLGTAVRNLVRKWLEAHSPEQLFMGSVGTSPSMADVIRLAWPSYQVPARAAIYRYLTGKTKPGDATLWPEMVRGFELWKSGGGIIPAVPHEMLTAQPLARGDWEQIARNASWTTTRMNLATFQRHGVFESSDLVNLVAARLRDPEQVRRARVFPFAILSAWKNSGADVPGVVKDALKAALEVSTENVPSVDGGLALCVDVSGSMSQASVTGERKGATSTVLCIEAAGLIAAVALRRNPGALVLPFDTVPRICRLEPAHSVIQNAMTLGAFRGGGTNVGSALEYLNAANATAKLVWYVSDNESWYGECRESTRLASAWAVYKRRVKGANLVCLNLQPGKTAQAPNAPDVLNLGGFSDKVFEVVAAFARGDADAWVNDINAIVL